MNIYSNSNKRKALHHVTSYNILPTSNGNYYDRGKALSYSEQTLIIDLYFQNNSSDDIASQLKRDVRTVRKYIYNYLNNVDTPKGRPINHNSEKDVVQFIKHHIETQPTSHIGTIVSEIFQEFNIRVSPTHVYYILKDVLHMSYKRVSIIARQRLDFSVKYFRMMWRENIWNEDIKSFIFIDETHFDNRSNNPHYGWFKVGDKAEVVGRYYSRMSWSLIAAISLGGLHYHQIFETTNGNGVKKHNFYEYIELLILSLPEAMRSNVTLIMDNAKVHHCKEIVDLMNSHHVKFIFLPKYSPDYNPIELFFGELKGKFRNANIEIVDTVDAVTEILTNISVSNIQSYIHKAYSNWRNNE